MTGEIGAEASNAGAKKRESKLAINSVEQLAGVFLAESVGLYVKQKSNENNNLGSHDEVMGWIKEDLKNLLEGLASSAAGSQKDEIITSSEILKNNLDSYVEKLDNSISNAMDKRLKEDGNLDPNGLAKDLAMLNVAPKSSYAKAGEALIKGEKTTSLPSSICKICAWVYDKIGKSDKANEYRAQAKVMNIRRELKVTFNEKVMADKKVPLFPVKTPVKDAARGGRG